jgi:hypothetical protein
MTQHARVVLQDAKFAISSHTVDLQSESFRISWISVITLLRAIGHVLEKVDANRSPEMKLAISSKWCELKSTKPDPEIYWEFIEKERNRFLKNYQHGIQRSITAKGPECRGKKSVIKFDVANSRGGRVTTTELPSSTISNGVFSGRNERDVAWEAYDWWCKYLDDIDELAKSA